MQIFRDQLLQKTIDADGIVIVPFLNQQETKQLEKYYKEHPLDLNLPYHSSVMSTDIEYRRNVHNKIQSVFSRAIERLFMRNYEFLFGCYTIKEQGDGSEWGVHQDWSFADESLHRSVGVWCPVIDVDYDNGCLGVLKGSHKFFPNIRGTNTITEYAGVNELIREKYLDFYPMKAGEAAIFYNNLIHYSPPNHGDQSRITANCTMLPSEAQPLHYFRDASWPESEIEVFEIDSEFLINNDYISQKRPEMGNSLGKIEHPVSELTKREFEGYVRKHQSFEARIRRMIKGFSGNKRAKADQAE